MCTALPQDNPFDRRAADAAGLAGALVNVKEILKVTAAVHPIDAGAMMLDAGLQYLADAG
jgi:hypothetical protein